MSSSFRSSREQKEQSKGLVRQEDTTTVSKQQRFQTDSTLSYFSILLYEDAACTKYAAQETYALNVCVPTTANQYMILAYTVTANEMNVIQTVYNDAACTVDANDPGHEVLPTSCGVVHNNFFGYATIVATPPTTYPVDGSVLTMYATQTACQSASGTVMNSIFLAYGGNTCVPGYNGNFMAANDFSGLYVGDSYNNCFASGPNAYLSCSSQTDTNVFDYLGYPSYLEYSLNPTTKPTAHPSVAPVPTALPTSAVPSLTPSAAPTTPPVEYISFVFYEDAVCTKFAGQESYVLNLCVPDSRHSYVYTTYTTSTTGYTLVSGYYTDSACTQRVGELDFQYATSACGLNHLNYGYAVVLDVPPSSYPVDGTLLNMYNSLATCQSATGTVMNSIFLAYGGNTCVPGYNGNFMVANDFSGVFIGDNSTTDCFLTAAHPGSSCEDAVTTNAFSHYGYPTYTELAVSAHSSSSSSDSTTTTIVVAVVVPVVVLLVAALGAYWYFSRKSAPLLRGGEPATNKTESSL